MSTTSLPRVPLGSDLERTQIVINQFLDEFDWLLGGFLDTKNVREIGGWLVSPDRLESKDKDVGMSTKDTGADDIRFFAGPNGDVWFYYVTKSGKLYATDAFIKGRIEGSVIIGSEIKTSETSYPRIELSSLGTFFKALGSVDKSIEISVSTEGTPGLFFKDPAGSALIDISTISFDIMSTIAMLLSAPTVRAVGIWTFNNTINGNITGHAASADYADHAGTASAADELSPSGEISWGQVLKNGSNIVDLETKNLSSLTQNSSYRTVSDAEKSIWNNKAGKDFPGWTASALLNSWSNFGGTTAPAGYYKDEFGVVRLRGFLNGGTLNTPIFTLPVGYRPLNDVNQPVVSNDSFGKVLVDTSGNVMLAIGSNNYVDLSPISFQTN